MLARNRYDTDILPLLVEPICIIAGRYRHSVHYRRKTVIEKSYHISFFRNEAAFMYRWGLLWRDNPVTNKYGVGEKRWK